MPRTAVIVGQSFDSFMSEMTVWDGNHRLVALFGKAYMKAKGLSCEKSGEGGWALEKLKAHLVRWAIQRISTPRRPGLLIL